MKAQIELIDGLLVAQLVSGTRLFHPDAVSLADLLWEHGVTSSEVTMIDWHQDVDRAPLSGHKVAIFHRLRLHELADD